jgi:hypothetical protein
LVNFFVGGGDLLGGEGFLIFDCRFTIVGFEIATACFTGLAMTWFV